MRKPLLQSTLFSIRTRFALASAVVWLGLLSIFYLGGRVLIALLMSQAEQEIQTAGSDLKTMTFKELQAIQQIAFQRASLLSGAGAALEHDDLRALLAPGDNLRPIHLAAWVASDGTRSVGVLAAPEAQTVLLAPDALARFFAPDSPVASELVAGQTPSGLLTVEGHPALFAALPVYPGGTNSGFLVLGTLLFESPLLGRFSRVSYHGMRVSVVRRFLEGESGRASAAALARTCPILHEIHAPPIKGFWRRSGMGPEATLPIRDVLGDEVATIRIQLPAAALSLLDRTLNGLVILVCLIGIVFITPIFWIQTRMVFEPLSSLVQQIRDGVRNDGDWSYLQWTDGNEYGVIAQSVNSLMNRLTRQSQLITQMEQRQTALIAGMPDALCVFDVNAQLVAVHKQPDYAHPIPGLILGSPLAPPIFPESDCEALRAAIAQTFRSEAVQVLLLACREPDGAYRHFETRISQMDRSNALVVLRDVTQEWRERETRQQMEARLTRIEKMESLGNLAAGIAHDVNNILSIIQNTLDTTWLNPTQDEEELAVSTIREAASKGATLTRELMTYAGHTRIAFKRLDPNRLVLDIEKLMGGVLASNVALELALTPDCPPVDADPHQFWKVIINILKNASEAIGGARGHISIRSYPFTMTEAIRGEFFSTHELLPSPGVVFQIDDSGSGMPPEVLARLFEPFFSTKAVGRGLGLSTVFGIVDAHNGGIAIRSAPGKGTTFRVWLPAAKESLTDSLPAEERPPATPTPAAPTPVRTPSAPSRRPCVLSVEDDPAILKTNGLLLAALGVEPLLAQTKREAQILFRKYADQINLILLDAQSGNLDNVRLLSTLRTRKPGVPAVLVSGHNEARIRELFATEPFNGFLSKPYTIHELKAALEAHLTHAPAQTADTPPGPPPE